jgi:ribose/xylose/arabinose/galactoside ABC-type transport system permease subunit
MVMSQQPAAPAVQGANPPGAGEPHAEALWLRLARPLGSILGPLIGLALVIGIFGAWQPDTFLSTAAFRNVFENNYHFVIAAVGATFVIITGGIDLSVGSTMALACVCCALAAAGMRFPSFDWQRGFVIAGGLALLAGLCVAGGTLQGGWPRLRALLWALGSAAVAAGVGLLGWRLLAGVTVPPLPLPAALLIGVAVGVLVGVVNGALITSLSLPPFIVTLATLGAVRGLTLYMTNGIPVPNVPESVSVLHYSAWVFGLSPNLWITIAVVVISVPLLHFTVLGRYAYAIGSNERTARLCGIPVEWWKTLCYVIAGGAAGLAGALMTATLGGRPTNFEGLELTAIAAVVIGGTSLFGGQGTVAGSILGVLMLGFLNTGCTMAGLSSYVQPIFIGATIVIAAAIDRFRHLGR